MAEEKDLEIKNMNMEVVEFKLVPRSARHYYTSNILDKELAYLVGWDETYFHLLRCDQNGKLLVVGPEKLITGYKAWDFSWSEPIETTEIREYEKPAEYTVINIFKGGINVRFRVHPFPQFLDWIRLQEGYYVFDVYFTAFEIKPWFYSEDVESVEVQIVAWW